METAAPSIHDTYVWTTHRICPIEWDSYIERCSGSFFHTPRGLRIGAPEGDALFIELRRGQHVIGVAAGILSPCRLSSEPRHVYFPTAPALLETAEGDAALAALVATLRSNRAAEVTVDSFAATWRPNPAKPAIIDRRREYVVSVTGALEKLARRCGSLHRRSIRRGERAGWRLRMLAEPAATTLLLDIQETIRERGPRPGDRVSAERPLTPVGLATDLSAPHGMAVFSAWEGATPLGASLVGWANGSAYFVVGGSTSKGYSFNSAAWLHWQIMCVLSTAGFRVYNLGGTAVSVSPQDDAADRPSRFEMEFGAEPVECHSVRWMLHLAHARAHELGRR